MKLDAAKIPVYLVCTIWAVYLLDLILPIRLNDHDLSQPKNRD